jgi:hypothetical protein
MRARRALAGLAAFAVAVFVAASAFAAGGVTTVKHTTPTTDGPSARTAKCGNGKHVLGGGFSSTDPETLTQQSFPLLEGWRAEALGGSPGSKASAYALCEKASARKLRVVTNRVTIPAPALPPDVAEGGVKATCPNGWQVVSGGYADRPPYQSGTTGEIAVDTSKRTDDRTWLVHGGNDGDPSDLEAFAICEKSGASQIKQISKTDDSAGTTQSAKAKCPNGAHVVGGGYQIKPNEAGGTFPRVLASKPVRRLAWKSVWVPIAAGSPDPPSVPTSLTSFAECES